MPEPVNTLLLPKEKLLIPEIDESLPTAELFVPYIDKFLPTTRLFKPDDNEVNPTRTFPKPVEARLSPTIRLLAPEDEHDVPSIVPPDPYIVFKYPTTTPVLLTTPRFPTPIAKLDPLRFVADRLLFLPIATE